jgi:hypothetical protein
VQISRISFEQATKQTTAALTIARESTLALVLLIILGPAAFAQVLEDQYGERVESWQDGDKTIINIYSPHVKEAMSEFRGIGFREGDRVRVEAGGCVQTGGVGRTWKRYVDPSGPNADRLYHGLIGLPYLRGRYPESRLVKGLVRLRDVIHREYVIPADKRADSPESFNLRLGYEDDDYGDNGYWGHDDGTEDQCRGVGNAFVTITITRSFPPVASAALNGSWAYTMKSSVSGRTFLGQLTLTVTGDQVVGKVETPDEVRGEVRGSYDPATGILLLTRDTGLNTLQKYSLRSTGNKFIGRFWNEGQHPDSGSFEFGKITL